MNLIMIIVLTFSSMGVATDTHVIRVTREQCQRVVNDLNYEFETTHDFKEGLVTQRVKVFTQVQAVCL